MTTMHIVYLADIYDHNAYSLFSRYTWSNAYSLFSRYIYALTWLRCSTCEFDKVSWRRIFCLSRSTLSPSSLCAAGYNEEMKANMKIKRRRRRWYVCVSCVCVCVCVLCVYVPYLLSQLVHCVTLYTLCRWWTQRRRGRGGGKWGCVCVSVSVCVCPVYVCACLCTCVCALCLLCVCVCTVLDERGETMEEELRGITTHSRRQQNLSLSLSRTYAHKDTHSHTRT